MDYSLEENSGNVLAAIDEALKRIEEGTFGTCARCGKTDRGGAPRGDAVRDEVHRLQTAGRAGLTDPGPRLIDVRVGSATDGRVPISVAERSLSATAVPLDRPGRRSRSPRSPPTSSRSAWSCASSTSGESIDVVGPFTIHHVRNSGIAFGLFSTWADAVTFLTAVAVLWMVAYFARSGARHPVLPVALGLLVGGSAGEPRRPRSASGTSPTSSTSATGRRSTSPTSFIVTGRRRPASAAIVAAERRPRRVEPAASRDPRTVPSGAAGERLDRFLAALDEVGSRSAAERLLADGGVRVDGEPAAEEPPPGGRGGARARAARAARRPRSCRRTFRSASPTRTSTSSSSTSPPASSSTRRAGHAARHARPRPARRTRSRAGASRERPGSSTGSTATPRASSSSPARTRRTAGSSGCCAGGS